MDFIEVEPVMTSTLVSPIEQNSQTGLFTLNAAIRIACSAVFGKVDLEFEIF